MTELRKETRYIVVHCSATPPGADIGKKEIDAWHRAKGWSSIGYHFVIRRNGVREWGRAMNVVGAHVQGYNHTSVGICMVGGVDANGKPENNFTEAQFSALKRLLAECRVAYLRAEILGHRDLSPDLNHDGAITSNEWMKACPSFDVRSWVKAVDMDGMLTVQQPTEAES